MTGSIAFIGFGEAAQAFAGAAAWRMSASAFDLKTDDDAQRAAKLVDYAAHNVTGCDTLEDALTGAAAVLSLVTADQAGVVAANACASLQANALFFDMNSVAPDTKRASAILIENAGGRYVDVAVMSPVHPKRLETPLLVSGPHAADALLTLRDAGFSNVNIAGAEVGRASSIKMIRSVMVKGIEALTAECVLAAEKADVLDDVLSSLGGDWPDKADYNFDRMMIHGIRRAAEMDEVVKTLEALDVPALMTRGTVARQRQIGQLGLKTPDDGLSNKLSQIHNKERQVTP